MASHSYEPTTAAALMPFLRASVNTERGHPSEGLCHGEGWERRNLFQLIKIWRAQRKLAKLLRQRRSSFEHQLFIRQSQAARKGWEHRKRG